MQTPPEPSKCLFPCQPRNKCIARTWIVHPLLNKKRRTSPQLIQVPGNMISNHLCLIAAGRPDRANLGFDILKTTSLHDVRPMSQYLTDSSLDFLRKHGFNSTLVDPNRLPLKTSTNHSGIQQPWRITLLSSLSCHKLLQPGHRGVLHPNPPVEIHHGSKDSQENTAVYGVIFYEILGLCAWTKNCLVWIFGSLDHVASDQ